MEFVIYRIESSSASDVDLLDMNLYWLSVSGLCLSVHFSSRFLNSFSRIFENWGIKITLRYVKLRLLPDLYGDITFAIFIQFGKRPVENG